MFSAASGAAHRRLGRMAVTRLQSLQTPRRYLAKDSQPEDRSKTASSQSPSISPSRRRRREPSSVRICEPPRRGNSSRNHAEIKSHSSCFIGDILAGNESLGVVAREAVEGAAPFHPQARSQERDCERCCYYQPHGRALLGSGKVRCLENGGNGYGVPPGAPRYGRCSTRCWVDEARGAPPKPTSPSNQSAYSLPSACDRPCRSAE